jgi:hypothetical protein
MILKYVTKDKLNEILDTHFTKFSTFKDMSTDDLEQFGYNIPIVLISDNNFYHLIECSIINETFETYKNDYNIFKQYKNNYLIGGYGDMFNNILYCTDTNYVDDKILTFINYAENYI